MASILAPYLQFQTTCREALGFYASVLGGEPRFMTFADLGMAEGDAGSLIAHGQLETPMGYTIMASDTPEGMPYVEGSRITMCLSGDDEQLAAYFDGLSAGGEVTQPLEQMVWGDRFGAFNDKFGIVWAVDISPKQA